MKDKAIKDILTENERRNAIVYAKFNPITGEGSVGKRVKCTISDFPIHTQWLPERIMKVPLVRQLIEAGSISKFLTDYMGVEDNQDDRLKVIEQFVRIRSREDFPFWAATFVYIKAKGGGEDVLFRLTRLNGVLWIGLRNCVLQGNRYASSCLKHGNGVVPPLHSFIWHGCSCFTKPA